MGKGIEIAEEKKFDKYPCFKYCTDETLQIFHFHIRPVLLPFCDGTEDS